MDEEYELILIQRLPYRRENSILISSAKKDVLIRILSRLPARAESPLPITKFEKSNMAADYADYAD